MNYKTLILGATCLLSFQATAGSMGDILPSCSKVITFSGGPAWYNEGRSQTIQLQEDVTKYYQAQSSTKALATGEIFFGVSSPLSETFSGQLGLAVAHNGSASQRGFIWEDADPNFSNYRYDYNISNTRITVKGKLLSATPYPWLNPYISAGAGIGFNKADNFSITPLIYQEVAAPPFASNTETAFSYTAGAGLQFPLNPNWQAGIGYEFADWGKSQLNRASNQTMNTGPKLSHFYTHELQISLTYIIG
ncbi:outer membrane protein [Legionella dresdenensis]|uniref:Outer membrane protein n=1 Tax=Legionella dresdenensis TaxID=450200 RepID=A0ABV8CDP0_9GAMM